MSRPILHSLISPMNSSEFEGSVQGRQYFHFEEYKRNLRDLLNWGDLNSMLSQSVRLLSYPWIRLVKDGKVIPEKRVLEPSRVTRSGTEMVISPAKIQNEMALGATLVLKSVETYFGTVADFVNLLSREICETVHANLYYSPGLCPAFDEHYDTHDIFVIQLEGRKRWFLRGVSHKYPLAHQDYLGHQPPHEVRPVVVETDPGQVLYIPRGYWHRAESDNASLHLTIGIYRQTKIDLLSWLTEEMADYEDMRKDFFSLTGEGCVEKALLDIEKAMGELLQNKQSLAKGFIRYRESAISSEKIEFTFPKN